MNRLGDFWGAETSPAGVEGAYMNAIEEAAPGFMDQASKLATPGEDWISLIARTMSTLAMTNAQRELLQVQVDRARQGLPPLDSSQYGLGATVGLSPATLRTLRTLLIGGILAAVLLFSRRR